MIVKINKVIKRISDEGLSGTALALKDKIRKPLKRKSIPKKIKAVGKSITDKELLESLQISRNAEENLLCYFQNRERPVFFIDKKRLQERVKVLTEMYPANVKSTLDTADKILRGDFKRITPNAPIFSNGIDWHSNFAGKSWPLDFYNELDYSGNKRLGDVREVWELNRHQHFTALGKAYWISGNRKYADEFFVEMRSWIASNPFGYGINWLHSQETAIRGVSWIWALYFFIEEFSDKDFYEYLKQIYLHAEFTCELLSDYRMTHNHLISEACGLAIIGIMFPEFKMAAKWRKTGIRIFEREIKKQVWSEGAHGELSTNYHLFVLDSFILLYTLMKLNGIKANPETESRIEKMIEYVMFMQKPDGTFPPIGDVDSGRAYKLSEHDSKDISHNLSTGAALFGRGDFKKASGKFYESSFWLLGEEGLKKYNELKAADITETSRLFPKSGFAYLRSGWRRDSAYLAYRIGPAALIKNVPIGHNHADLLSFELYAGGRTLLFDPGIYLYSSDENSRTYFRKTSSHNTVTVNGLDQIDVSKTRFGLPELPLSKTHEFKSTDEYDYCDASSTAYEKIGALHRRKILFVKSGYMVLVDEISGGGVKSAEQYFHIDAQRAVKDDDKKVEVFSGSQKTFEIFQLGEGRLAAEIVTAKDDSIEGWASYLYGEKHKASFIKFGKTGQENIIFISVINFNPSQEKFIIADYKDANSSKEIEICMDNFTDKIIINDIELIFNRARVE